jgi:hypothetical protein
LPLERKKLEDPKYFNGFPSGIISVNDTEHSRCPSMNKIDENVT